MQRDLLKRRGRVLRIEMLEDRQVLTPVVSVGQHLLLPNTPNQVIPIYVSGGDLVEGMNLNIQVADGGPEAAAIGLAPDPGIDGPVIQNLDILTGTIFASNNSGEQNPEQALAFVIPQWEARSVTTLQGSVAAQGLLATVTIDTRGFSSGTWALRMGDTINGSSDFALVPMTITDGSITVAPQVVGRHVFYNGSFWDNKDLGANAADDNAIAPDKVALLPGHTATFSNYISYSRGLNGIMIDVAGLPSAKLTAADFTFRYGNTSTPATWAAAPNPTSITVRPGAGAGGSSRITLIWPNNAIPDRNWLQVTLKADAQTGLVRDDVFYFGLAIGDTGDSATSAMVSSYDVIRTRDNVRGFAIAAKENVFDFDRSGKVDSFDVIVCRDHVSGFRFLALITPPASTGAGVMAVSETAGVSFPLSPTPSSSVAVSGYRQAAYRDAVMSQDPPRMEEALLFELAQMMELVRFQSGRPTAKHSLNTAYDLDLIAP